MKKMMILVSLLFIGVTIACAEPVIGTVSQDGYPDVVLPQGGDPTHYTMGLKVYATDGVTKITLEVGVNLPADTKRNQFNEAIIHAAVAAIQTARPDWVVDPRNLFFVPFDNGN
jgi:hypothetical protein